MREIKFKVNIKGTSIVADVKHISFIQDNIVMKIYDSAVDEEILFDCDEVELLQYTGLKDRNGVEIYEGDYIKYLGKTYRVIRNFTGAFVGKMKILGEEEVFVCYIYSECEVIGNVYERI